MMQRVSVQLPDDLFADVSRAAVAESRSLSSEIVVRLRRALAGGGGSGQAAVVALPASAPSNGDAPTGGGVPAAVLRAAPAAGRARTVMCEHRIPVSGFCKVCDGG